jgi:hypothetical protein
MGKAARRSGRMFGAFVVLTALSSIHAAQDDGVEWTRDTGLRRADKTAILTLARQMGIEKPRRATVVPLLPLGGSIVIVQSGITSDGPRRTWRELEVCRADWPCAPPDGFRIGRWIANGKTEERERWRIRERDWHVDVFLESGVAYEAAETIVLAFRRGTGVNRMPGPGPGREWATRRPNLDASEIFAIEWDADKQEYEVRAGRDGGGEVYWVQIRDGRVELHGIGTWIA